MVQNVSVDMYTCAGWLVDRWTRCEWDGQEMKWPQFQKQATDVASQQSQPHTLLITQHTENTHSAKHFRTDHSTSGMSTHWNHSAKHFRTEHSTSGMLQDKENDSFNHKELSSSLSVKDNTYINVLKTVKFWCFTIEHNDSISQLEWHSSACYNTQKTMHWKLWTELLVWHNTMTVLTNQSWACQFDKSINVTLKPVTKVDKCQFQSKWTESQLLQ